MLRAELAQSNVALSRELKDVNLMYYLSKAQAYIGNRWRLRVLVSQLYHKQGVSVYNPSVTIATNTPTLPDNILSILSLITPTGERLKEYSLSEIKEKDFADGYQIGYAFDNRSIFLNYTPEGSYDAVTNPHGYLDLTHYHRFRVFTGEAVHEYDNYDETLEGEFYVPYDEALLTMAVGYVNLPKLTEYKMTVETIMESLQPKRSSELKYHLGV